MGGDGLGALLWERSRMTQERGIDAQERYERGNHLLNSRTTLPVEKNKTGSKRPWPMADEDGGYTIGNL